MPSPAVWYDWIADDETIAEKYARAREACGEHFGLKVLWICREILADRIDANKGRVVIDGYKWVAGRMNPGSWGDHRTLDVNVKEHHVKEIRLVDGQAPRMEDAGDEALPDGVGNVPLLDVVADVDATPCESTPLGPVVPTDDALDPLAAHDDAHGCT